MLLIRGYAVNGSYLYLRISSQKTTAVRECNSPHERLALVGEAMQELGNALSILSAAQLVKSMEW